jgi:hypothetical protein
MSGSVEAIWVSKALVKAIEIENIPCGGLARTPDLWGLRFPEGTCRVLREGRYGGVAHTCRRFLSACMRPSGLAVADMPEDGTSAPPTLSCMRLTGGLNWAHT